MTSGGTSWQYYNNSSKYKMPPPNSQAAFGAAGGDMQDMHLKMSKKIAQLTKVSLFEKFFPATFVFKSCNNNILGYLRS